MAGSGAKEMWRWLAGYSSGVCKEEERYGGVQMDCLYTKEISPGTKPTNIIVMVLSENDNNSTLSI